MQNLIARFVKDESGATAIEYGLIASLISVAIISAASTLGKNVANTFTAVSSQMTATK
jgi:pilus assembly protein Flp/PilA